MPTKSPRARRLEALLWSVIGAWCAVGFGILLLGGLMLLGTRRGDPRDRAIREATAVASWVFLVVAAAWILSLFRVLPIDTRIKVLCWCLVVIGTTAVAWLVWVLLRGSARVG